MDGETEMSAQVVVTSGLLEAAVDGPAGELVGERSTQMGASKGEPIKASGAEVSDGAKRVQKIIESMDLRRQERARLIAAKKSREVEVEREDREANERLCAALHELQQEYERRVLTAQADCSNATGARAADLNARQFQIDKIDISLANFRKQLDAELLKLDPERKAGA